MVVTTTQEDPMDPLEAETLKQLKEQGFEDIKITGRFGDEVTYSHTDGEPVLDAPIARVVGDGIELLPWMDRLK